MPSNMGKRYDADFKAKVMQDLEDSGDSAVVVGQRHNISEKTIYAWRLHARKKAEKQAAAERALGKEEKKIAAKVNPATTDAPENASMQDLMIAELQAQIQSLKDENKRLKDDIAMMKGTIAIFSRT